jgi:hypothetical protein
MTHHPHTHIIVPGGRLVEGWRTLDRLPQRLPPRAGALEAVPSAHALDASVVIGPASETLHKLGRLSDERLGPLGSASGQCRSPRSAGPRWIRQCRVMEYCVDRTASSQIAGDVARWPLATDAQRSAAGGRPDVLCGPEALKLSCWRLSQLP